jgi:hypothetical protein
MTVNNHGLIIHKTKHKRKEKEDMIIISIKRIILKLKQVVNVFDLGYLGVEKDFPEQKSYLPNRKKRNIDLSVDEKGYNQNHSRKRG